MNLVSTWDKTWVFFAEQYLAGAAPPGIPSLYDFVDAGWSPSDREQLLWYLEHAPTLMTLGPDVRCPLCHEQLGNVRCWRSDGLWCWRDDLSHYVRKHSVRLPDAMVERIRIRRYMLPEPSEVDWPELSMPGKCEHPDK